MKALLILCLAAPLAIPADAPPLAGFTADSSRAERDWEAKFRAIPDPANLPEIFALKIATEEAGL